MKKLIIIVSVVCLGLAQAYSQGDEHRHCNKGQEQVAMVGDTAQHHCCTMNDSLKNAQSHCCKQMPCCGHDDAMKMCGGGTCCGGGAPFCGHPCCMKHHMMQIPFLLFLLLLLITVFTFKYLRTKLKYQVVLKSLEVGQPIPAEFLNSLKCCRKNLKLSVLLLSFGLGTGLMFLILHKERGAACSIVFIFLGLAFLLLHFVEKCKCKSKCETTPTDKQ